MSTAISALNIKRALPQPVPGTTEFQASGGGDGLINFQGIFSAGSGQ